MKIQKRLPILTESFDIISNNGINFETVCKNSFAHGNNIDKENPYYTCSCMQAKEHLMKHSEFLECEHIQMIKNWELEQEKIRLETELNILRNKGE